MNCRRRVISLAAAAALSGVPARAATIDLTATIPGGDFSLPASIGTFTYALPADATIELAILFSAEYDFAAAASPFGLLLSFDGVPTLVESLPAGVTRLLVGSGVTHVAHLLGDGSATLSASCHAGPCAPTFTRGTPEDWRLFLRYSVPEPSSLLLLLLGSAVAVAWRTRRAGTR